MAKTTREGRRVASEKKGPKGKDLEVLEYVTITEARKRGYEDVLVPCFGREEFCSSASDVTDVLDERNLSGEFVPVRRPCGIIRRKAVVRSEKTEEGFKEPVEKAEKKDV